MRVEFHGLTFELPHGWEEITQDLPQGAPPSLARQGGVGAIQLSFAKYRDGDRPNVTIAVLRELLDDFFCRNRMPYDNVAECEQRMMSVRGASTSDSGFVLARYFSNGEDVALATYVCMEAPGSEMLEDLKGVETIMNSMEF